MGVLSWDANDGDFAGGDRQVLYEMHAVRNRPGLKRVCGQIPRHPLTTLTQFPAQIYPITEISLSHYENPCSCLGLANRHTNAAILRCYGKGSETLPLLCS